MAAACVPVASVCVRKSLGIFYNLMRKWIYRCQSAVKVGLVKYGVIQCEKRSAKVPFPVTVI